MTSFVLLQAEGLATPGRAGEGAGLEEVGLGDEARNVDAAKKREEAESLRKQGGDKPSQRRVAAGES
jgi:hypothetical protein